MNKRLFYEMIIIILIASAIGLAYNAFISDPIPLIYKPKEKNAVADSILFSSNQPETKDNAEDSVYAVDVNGKDTLQTQTIIKDTNDIKELNKKENSIENGSDAEIKNENDELVPGNAKGKLYGHLEEFDNWVSVEQVKKALGKPNIQFIDAREPEAFEKGRIGNAIHIFPDFDTVEEEEEYFRKIMSLDPQKTYILYCNGYSCDLAEMVARDILSFGHVDRVFIFPGGWDQWIKHADT